MLADLNAFGDGSLAEALLRRSVLRFRENSGFASSVNLVMPGLRPGCKKGKLRALGLCGRTGATHPGAYTEACCKKKGGVLSMQSCP